MTKERKEEKWIQEMPGGDGRQQDGTTEFGDGISRGKRFLINWKKQKVMSRREEMVLRPESPLPNRIKQKRPNTVTHPVLYIIYSISRLNPIYNIVCFD